MKQGYLKWLIFAGILGITTFQFTQTYTYSNGPPPGNTGAPGEMTCASSGCHDDFSLNSGSNGNAIAINSDMVNNFYAEDSTYQITVNFSHPNLQRAGFQMTAYDASNSGVGNFIITNPNSTQGQTGSQPQYVYHTNSSTFPTNNQISWTFDWEAPSSDQGNVTFYLALNDADNNNNSSGDSIYTKTMTASYYNNTPVPSIQASKTDVCVGDTVQFSGTATGSPTDWNWSFPNGTPAQSSQQNVSVVFNQAGTYQVSLSASDSIATSDPVNQTIQVRSKPSANISLNGSTSVCPGDSVELVASSGDTYEWSTGDTTQSIYVNDSGSYFVALSNPACADTSGSVQIDQLPDQPLNLSSSVPQDTFCAEQGITFNATTGFNAYQFIDANSNDTLLSGALDSLSLPNPSKDLSVYVTNGCQQSSDTIQKRVDTLLSKPTITCANTTSSSLTFSWNAVSGASGYEVSIDSGRTWMPIDSTSYKVSGLDFQESYQLRARAIDSNSACLEGNEAIQTCQTEPCTQISFNLTRDSVICEGEQADFTFSNFSTSNYAIAFNAQPFSDQRNYSVSPVQTDTIEVQVIDSTQLNCPPVNFDYIVQVNPSPEVNLSLNDPTGSYCEGDTVLVNGDLQTGAYDYFLNDNLVQQNADDQYNSTQLTEQDSIYAVVTGNNSCTDTTNIVTIQNIYQRTDVTITPDQQNAQYCEGDTIGINGSLMNGIYDYYVNDTLYLQSADTAITSTRFNDQDDLFAIVADTNGCLDTSNTVNIQISPNPDVGFTHTINDLEVTLSDTTSGNIQNRMWRLGEGTTEQQQNFTHTYDTSGTFQVTLEATTDAGCVGTVSDSIMVENETGIASKTSNTSFKIYPNPVNDQLTVAFERSLKKPQKLMIYSITGTKAKTINLTRNQQAFEIPVHKLPEGNYILRVQDQVLRMIKK